MTLLRKKMVDDMQLRRLSPSTQHSYVEAVSGLARFYHKTPDKFIFLIVHEHSDLSDTQNTKKLRRSHTNSPPESFFQSLNTIFL